MSLTFAVLGVSAARARILGLEDEIEAAASVGMGRAMLQAQSIVRGNASGRPGPRAPTGDFRRSIVGDSEAGPLGIRGRVGSSAPQAARLEYGFRGQDSLGRSYNQPPYPWLLRSAPEIETIVQREITAAMSTIR